MKFADVFMVFLAIAMAYLFFTSGLSVWIVGHYLAQGVYWASRYRNRRSKA